MTMELLNLIQGADVEYKKLGEVATVQRGASPRPIKKFITEDAQGIPWIKIGDIAPHSKYVEKTAEKITQEGVQKSRFLHKGDFIISNSMSFGRPYILAIDGCIHDGWAALSDFGDVLNSDFLFYYLSSNKVQNYWIEKVNVGGVGNLNSDIIKSLEIPIPSLEIQQKVVEILDKMTDYVTELTAELTLRQKQYAYYRDQLLTFPSQSVSDESVSVKWMTLGEIGEVRMCKRILKSQTSSTGEVPFFKIGTFGKKPNAFISRALFEEYKEKYSYPKVGDLLISASGTIGRIVKFDGKDAYFQDSNIVWIDNDETQVRNDYLRYYYQIANWGTSQGGTITRLYNDGLKKMKIAVPPLELQYKIVEILDKFDKLTSDLSEGLPREIELRQKQYEYWREQLLSFKKE